MTNKTFAICHDGCEKAVSLARGAAFSCSQGRCKSCLTQKEGKKAGVLGV